MAPFQNSFIEMFLEWPSTKICWNAFATLNKMATRARTISISYSTEDITFMANLSSGVQSRAIMALLFPWRTIKKVFMNVVCCTGDWRFKGHGSDHILYLPRPSYGFCPPMLTIDTGLVKTSWRGCKKPFTKKKKKRKKTTKKQAHIK